MIVRLRTLEFLNLAHATHGERTSGGGMRVFIIAAQPHDLPPDDADRLRRRLVELDPEPVPGTDAPTPPGPPLTSIVENRPRLAPKRRRRDL